MLDLPLDESFRGTIILFDETTKDLSGYRGIVSISCVLKNITDIVYFLSRGCMESRKVMIGIFLWDDLEVARGQWG